VSELKKALEQERARAQALAQEKTAASEKLASLQASQSQAGQERSAAAAQLAEVQKSLQQERERAQALARESSAARQELASLQASRERTASAEVSELKKALEQERARAQALAQEKTAAMEKLASVTQAKFPDRYVSLETSSVTADPVEAPPNTASVDSRSVSHTGSTVPGNPLVERADALLRRGDVSGARLLLERALDDGDARAVLLLAQSFDPQVLSALGVRGMRGDLAKAEELRAKARAMQARDSVQAAPPR
jgi:hypothetical protein